MKTIVRHWFDYGLTIPIIYDSRSFNAVLSMAYSIFSPCHMTESAWNNPKKIMFRWIWNAAIWPSYNLFQMSVSCCVVFGQSNLNEAEFAICKWYRQSYSPLSERMQCLISIAKWVSLWVLLNSVCIAQYLTKNVVYLQQCRGIFSIDNAFISQTRILLPGFTIIPLHKNHLINAAKVYCLLQFSPDLVHLQKKRNATCIIIMNLWRACTELLIRNRRKMGDSIRFEELLLWLLNIDDFEWKWMASVIMGEHLALWKRFEPNSLCLSSLCFFLPLSLFSFHILSPSFYLR